MKRVLLVIVALAVAVPLYAQTGVDGRTSTEPRFQKVGGTDGTTDRMARVGPNGELMVGDAARDRDKTDALTLLSAVSLAAATSSSVSAFVPFTQSASDALKWLRVVITGGSTNAPWSLVMLGSDAAVTYSFLMDSPASVVGVRWLDGDTLKVRGHGPTPAGGILIPVATRSGYPVITKNLAVIARHDTSAGAAFVFTVEALGRGF
jgi:hypothetical protein